MKGPTALQDLRWRAPPGCEAGSTLAEVLIASTLLLLLLGAVLGANLFGLRMSLVTQTKLNTSDAARRIMGPLTDEIRGCKSARIGNVTNGMFVGLLDGERQAGTGLILFPTTNTADYIIYFLNLSDQSFRRTSSEAEAVTLLARGVTNTAVFSARDCLGNTLTNSQNSRVIHFELELVRAEAQLPSADYCKLETSVAKRPLE